MAKYNNPEIKVIQNGIKREPSFIKRQASKIFDINQAAFYYTTDLVKNSTNSVYFGTMSVSLWCVLKLLNVSRYFEQVSSLKSYKMKNSKH